MRWASAKKLTVLLLVLFAGCGEDTEPSASLSGVEPSSLLVQKSDFPRNVEAGELPSEEACSPLSVLREQGGKAAISSLFTLQSEAVAEAVGVVPSEEAAQQALEELGQEDRLECVKEAIEGFTPKEGGSVEYVAPVPSSAGEEGSLIRFTGVNRASKPVSTTLIVSFRSGRCVASLLFLAKGQDGGKAFVDRVSNRADERLADAHSTCR